MAGTVVVELVTGVMVLEVTVAAPASKAPIDGGFDRTAPVMSKAGAKVALPALAAGELAAMRRKLELVGLVLRKSGSAPRVFRPRVRPLLVP